MRKLVIDKILTNLKKGLDETGLDWINYKRANKNRKIITPEMLTVNGLQELSNEELLYVMDAQACQKYR